MPKSTRLLILLLLFVTNVCVNAQTTNSQTDVSGFLDASASGKQKLVDSYLAAGMDINARDEFLQTALYVAAAEKQFEQATALVEKGADPNLANDDGRTPLLASIHYGFDTNRYERRPESQALVNALLARGADVNARDKDGTTPLEEAARLGDADTIRALVARGANPATKNNDGETALDVAAQELRGYAVRALIDAGAPMTTRQKLQYLGYRVARVEGWILPFLIVFSFLVGYFGKKLTRPQPKRRAVESGDALPHLAPLKCVQCGAGVPLNHEELKCPRCDTPVPVPEDYGETVRLRAKAAEKMERAVAAWRRANLFTVWPLRLALWLLAPVLLVLTAFGTFSKLGDSLFAVDTKTAFLGLFAVLGGLSLAVALWAYASYLGGTRKRLPLIPVVGQKVGEAEVTNCHLCGGGISYAAGDLAAICGYCGGETYRVQLTRRARAVAAAEKEQAALSLYDAMAEIVERRQRAFRYLYKTALVVFGLALVILIYAV
ncbi:MAG TPA: ankyrin repeat domain-containing protein [Pyrinomonadaceae bacterium]|nr:ankyrin repeat domain-containing protein [Pyrinomonadaceae bacterium]